MFFDDFDKLILKKKNMKKIYFDKSLSKKYF
jgi:hypothetical protein